MKLPIFLNEPPNYFDPERVHRDLEVHKELWISVTYMHHQLGTYGDPDSQVKATSYLLMAQPGMENQLIQLAAGWQPGKLEWATKNPRTVLNSPIKRFSGPKPKVLKVTWVE